MKVINVLFKSKVLKNGEHPIMIRIYHQKIKYFATGVSTKVEYWNEAKKTVTSKDKNYKEKNKIILDKYMYVMKRISEFDTLELDYDLDLLTSDEEIKKEEVNSTNENEIKHYDNFLDILDAMILTYNEGSGRKYVQLRNALVQLYGDNIPVTEIKKEWFSNFERNLSPKGLKQAKELIKRFLTTYKFGFEEGYITNFIPLKYNQKNYQTVIKKRTLNVEGFSFLQSQFEREHKDWMKKWLDEDIAYPFITNNYFNALNLFLIMVAFDGLSPIDLSLLRMSDLEKKKYNVVPLDWMRIHDEKYNKEYNSTNQIIEYYSINLLRKKSKGQVDIKLPCALINFLIGPYIINQDKTIKKGNDFVFNVFDNNTFDKLTDKQRYSRMSNYWNTLATALNINIRDNVNAPAELKEKKITFYVARHTALNVLLDKGASIEEVAKMAGHNVETLKKSYLGEYDVRKKVEANMKVWSIDLPKREKTDNDGNINDDDILNEGDFEVF